MQLNLIQLFSTLILICVKVLSLFLFAEQAEKLRTMPLCGLLFHEMFRRGQKGPWKKLFLAQNNFARLSCFPPNSTWFSQKMETQAISHKQRFAHLNSSFFPAGTPEFLSWCRNQKARFKVTRTPSHPSIKDVGLSWFLTPTPSRWQIWPILSSPR